MIWQLDVLVLVPHYLQIGAWADSPTVQLTFGQLAQNMESFSVLFRSSSLWCLLVAIITTAFMSAAPPLLLPFGISVDVYLNFAQSCPNPPLPKRIRIAIVFTPLKLYPKDGWFIYVDEANIYRNSKLNLCVVTSDPLNVKLPSVTLPPDLNRCSLSVSLVLPRLLQSKCVFSRSQGGMFNIQAKNVQHPMFNI